jgi:isochorismate synthase EntC
MTRKEYQEKVLADIDAGGVVQVVLIQKAKDEIRKKYNGTSEIQEVEYNFTANSGVHIHHILPQSSFPQFSLYRENLIALTPGQHLSFAHVQGNTQRVDSNFQKICIKRKFENIKESLNRGESFYNLSQFVDIFNNALNLNLNKNSSISEIDSAIATV